MRYENQDGPKTGSLKFIYAAIMAFAEKSSGCLEGGFGISESGRVNRWSWRFEC